jgi:gamma-aminobutyric acid type B receptor
MGSAIIPLSLDPGVVSLEGASRACIAMPWLLACGFSLTFSALFTKTHRILTIMRNAASFKRVKVTALDVAKPMIALLFTNVIILAIWTGIDPLRSETIILERNSFLQPTVTENVCYSDNRGIYLGVLGVINLGALLVAFIEAYLARNISVELSESAYIMKVFFIILLVSFIGIPVIIIARENTSAFYFVTVGIIFVVCFSILCLIFVPKIIASRKPPVRRTSSGFTRTSAVSETEDEGIKILSSPKAVKELEEENRKLKAAMAQKEKEGRRMSSQQSYPSSTDDLEAQGLMKSVESNGAEMDAVKEEDADVVKQKTVTIMTGTMSEE